MRSLARRDMQANSIASGTASVQPSSASAAVTADSPAIWGIAVKTTARASPETLYRYVWTADLQQFRRPQRHEAEQHRTQRQRHYHRLPAPGDG